MLELLADLVRNKNMQLILSSHLLPDVEVVCDQVAVLDQGHLVASGALDSLLQGARRTYEVRLKGPIEAFETGVTAQGGSCQRGQRGMLHVEGIAGGSQDIFALALQADCQVRHLMPARQTLTEVFRSSVAPGGAHADP
jgi:ABC-2 type transport system ATP-binding protein